MVDVALSVARVLAALLLVLLNGFFVAAEFAYVRIRSTTVDRLVEEGRAGAGALREAMDNLDDYLAVTQLGITIASLGLGWIGEPAVAALIEPVLASLLPESLIHLVAFAVGFGIITFLHVVFGELAPKTIAIAQAERIALFVAPPMKGFYYLFVPGIVVFNGTANAFTRLLGVPPARESEESLGEQELLRVLSQSGQAGHIDADEVRMIERVFDLDDVPARAVMVPRPDVVALSADQPLSEVRSVAVEAGHTRYPVLDAADDDQVVGYVDVKDVLRVSDAGWDGAEPTAADIAHDLPVVPETALVVDLLSRFQSEQRQMAAVVDEWGAFEGVVTVEDAVEVVVGDIRDEFDVDEREASLERRGDGSYVADGQVLVSTVDDRLDTDLAAAVDDVETIGGLVLEQLGRVPEAGDAVTVDGVGVRVEAVDGARVVSVVVEPGDEPASPE